MIGLAMLITPHSITGATIAVIFPNPIISVPMSIGAHFALDKIPHWQEILYPYKLTWKTWARIPTDLILSLILVNAIAVKNPDNSNLIWGCAILSNLPDLDSTIYVWNYPFKKSVTKKYLHWHNHIQRETPSVFGMLTQVIVVLTGLMISLR